MKEKKGIPIFGLITRCDEKFLEEVIAFSKNKNLKTIGDLIRFSEIELQMYLNQDTIDILKKVLHDDYNLMFSDVHSEEAKTEAGKEEGKEKPKKKAGGAPPIHGFDCNVGSERRRAGVRKGF
jgi:hypothetical protein